VLSYSWPQHLSLQEEDALGAWSVISAFLLNTGETTEELLDQIGQKLLCMR